MPMMEVFAKYQLLSVRLLLAFWSRNLLTGITISDCYMEIVQVNDNRHIAELNTGAATVTGDVLSIKEWYSALFILLICCFSLPRPPENVTVHKEEAPQPTTPHTLYFFDNNDPDDAPSDSFSVYTPDKLHGVKYEDRPENGSAYTDSDWTAASCFPIISEISNGQYTGMLMPREDAAATMACLTGIILYPTKELSGQRHVVVTKSAHQTGLKATAVRGGTTILQQIRHSEIVEDMISEAKAAAKVLTQVLVCRLKEIAGKELMSRAKKESALEKTEDLGHYTNRFPWFTLPRLPDLHFHGAFPYYNLEDEVIFYGRGYVAALPAQEFVRGRASG